MNPDPTTGFARRGGHPGPPAMSPMRRTGGPARPERNERIRGLWDRYVADRDPGARRELIDQYLGLVYHAAREIANRQPGTLDLDDLVGAGTIGLVQALESFDPARGYAFSSYAVPRIRGAILDEIRAWDWVPRAVREKSRRLARVVNDLRQRFGRQPEPAEVAAALEVDMETYWDILATSRDPRLVPIDPDPATGENSAGFSLSETLTDDSEPGAQKALEASEQLAELQAGLTALSQRDRLVLTLSYYERLTLQQIAGILQITESRVSQIRTRALKRLKEELVGERQAA